MRKQRKNHQKASATFILRMSQLERAELKRLAALLNLTQAAFIRAKIFDGLPLENTPSNLGLDHEALCKLLVTLSDSHLASNLNQLAKHANMGTLNLKSDEIEAQLIESYHTIQWMRRTIITALGLKP